MKISTYGYVSCQRWHNIKCYFMVTSAVNVGLNDSWQYTIIILLLDALLDKKKDKIGNKKFSIHSCSNTVLKS